MSLIDVYGMIYELRNTPSQNEKVSLLKNFAEFSPFAEEFKRVVRMALSPDLRYSIKTLGTYSGDRAAKHKIAASKVYTDEYLLTFLESLTVKQGVKDSEKELLIDIAHSSPSSFAIANMIVGKNLKCGCGAKVINAAIPGLVRITPYMRCMGCEEGLKRIDYSGEGAYVQRKADATFAYGLNDIETGKPVIMSRIGMVLDFCGVFDEDIKLLGDNVISMEVVGRDPVTGRLLHREISNGISNKALRKTIKYHEADMMVGYCWDIVPQDKFWAGYDPTPYSERFKKTMALSFKMQRITTVDNWRVTTEEDVMTIANAIIEQEKGEGVVVKNAAGSWENKTSPNQVKVKRKRVGEFRVNGWYKGDAGKKYENCMGGLYIETEDRLLKGKVASGFNDCDRGYLGTGENGEFLIDEKKLESLDNLIGAIISVEFDSVMCQKTNKGEEYSLFLPIFIEFRYDKSEADTLSYLLKIAPPVVK